MNYYYITGASRGIGKALVEILLENSSNKVVGISRECTIQHDNYTHLSIDLSNANALSSIQFGKHLDAKKVVLINNAGTLGEVKHVGNLTSNSIIKSYTVNLITPAVLTNSFMNAYQSQDIEKIILNISSGAGKNPVDGWSVYCSTKAGLDMFSQAIDKEQKSNNKSSFKVYSIAPGVVDTTMQAKIRNTSKSDFSNVDSFISLQKSNQLSDPVAVAKKYLSLLDNTYTINGVLDSLREH